MSSWRCGSMLVYYIRGRGWTTLFLLTAYGVWGKVKFLHVSVILSTIGGMGVWSGLRGVWSEGRCLVWGLVSGLMGSGLGGVWSGGMSSLGGVRSPPPPEMATATVGTHPTGKIFFTNSVTSLELI